MSSLPVPDHDLVPFEKVRDQLHPFDLLLFSGGDFVSSLIKFLERKKLPQKVKGVPPGTFSHVGMVVTSEILDHPQVLPGRFYVFESTISGRLGQGVPDVEGRSFLGVQLRDLELLLPKYLEPKGTLVAVASLLTYPSSDLKERFTTLFNSLNGTPYDANPVDLLSAMFGCLRCCRKPVQKATGSSKWLFCSELVALVYREMGILPPTTDPENVLPMDFVGYDEDSEESGGIPLVVKLPPTYLKS